MKKKTRAYRAPWYAQHFEFLHLWVRARYVAPPAEKVEQELASIFEEGDRRRAERNVDTHATTDPISAAAGRRAREKHRLCALISRPFVGIPVVLTGAAGTVHTDIETTGARLAVAIPAYDWREKQWLSDLIDRISRPFVGIPAVLTGAAGTVHTDIETTGARSATAIPAYDWKEKQWLSDLIDRPFVGIPAVLTAGAVVVMLAVGWGDYMPR